MGREWEEPLDVVVMPLQVSVGQDEYVMDAAASGVSSLADEESVQRAHPRQPVRTYWFIVVAANAQSLAPEPLLVCRATVRDWACANGTSSLG